MKKYEYVTVDARSGKLWEVSCDIELSVLCCVVLCRKSGQQSDFHTFRSSCTALGGGLTWWALLVFPSFGWAVLPATEPRQACSNCSSSAASPRLDTQARPTSWRHSKEKKKKTEPSWHRDTGIFFFFFFLSFLERFSGTFLRAAGTLGKRGFVSIRRLCMLGGKDRYRPVFSGA